MWYRRRALFALQVLILIGCTKGFERVYLTSLYDNTGACNHQSSLEYGLTVEWDPENIFNRDEFAFRPGWVFDCAITFIARTHLYGMDTRTSLAFRENFIFSDVGLATNGLSKADCGRAYVQLFKQADYPYGPPIWTFCSLGDIPGLGNVDTKEFVYELTPPERNLVLFFHVDFVIQQISNYTVNPNLTTTTLITTPNPNDYPKIHFHADFTSYVHKDNCINPNDEKYLRCNDSRRCLARTDVCDVGFGWNCRDNDFYADNSDKVCGYPSYCDNCEDGSYGPGSSTPGAKGIEGDISNKTTGHCPGQKESSGSNTGHIVSFAFNGILLLIVIVLVVLLFRLKKTSQDNYDNWMGQIGMRIRHEKSEEGYQEYARVNVKKAALQNSETVDSVLTNSNVNDISQRSDYMSMTRGNRKRALSDIKLNDLRCSPKFGNSGQCNYK